MKKAVLFMTTIITVLIAVFTYSNKVYAESITKQVQEPQGSLVQLKENQAKSLEEYKEKYGSDAYGLTAFILHGVQVYSIPFCFLAIVISIMYKIIIGARHLENAEKGLGMIVAIVTLTIICQVLPLIFAVVVKMGRE